MAAAAPAAGGPSGAVLNSMEQSRGAGGAAGFKGGLQVFFGGKEFPAITSGFSMQGLLGTMTGVHANLLGQFAAPQPQIGGTLTRGAGEGIFAGGGKGQGASMSMD